MVDMGWNKPDLKPDILEDVLILMKDNTLYRGHINLRGEWLCDDTVDGSRFLRDECIKAWWKAPKPNNKRWIKAPKTGRHREIIDADGTFPYDEQLLIMSDENKIYLASMREKRKDDYMIRERPGGGYSYLTACFVAKYMLVSDLIKEYEEGNP